MGTAEIVLAINQTAEPGTCGSCRFFERRNAHDEYDTTGCCKFRLPPTRVYQRQKWDADSQPLDTVRDTDGCDLWRSDCKTYIVQRRVRPRNPE